jgi:hypothetical protein
MTVNSHRIGRLAGIWFIATFVFSIPAVALYGPVLDHPGCVASGAADGSIEWGALLEVVLVVANIGTAIVLFPILKRHSERLALGYVAIRIVESTLIVIGIVSLLAVITLHQDVSGGLADAGSTTVTTRSLVAIHDATFLLGPSFCAGIGNGILLGYLAYRSGIVPRRMAMIGLVGGPLAVLAAILALFGAYEQNSDMQLLITMPEIVWEAAFGIYLAVKGFANLVCEGLAVVGDR